MRMILAALAATLVATPALAQSTDAAARRDYCPARPGLGEPPCTVAPGEASAELGILDWTRDASPGARNDTLVAGDLLLRFGIGDQTEISVGWTALIHNYSRDAGGITRGSGVGDVTIALKQNLVNPDGSGPSIAIKPYLTVPTGRTPFGAGDWGAGLTGAASFDLSDTLSLQFTPEIAAAVDGDGRGRHLALSGIVGLGMAVTETLGATIEFQAVRDNDPAGRTTETYASFSLGFAPRDGWQLDAGIVAGLNAASPDVELYFGVSRRF